MPKTLLFSFSRFTLMKDLGSTFPWPVIPLVSLLSDKGILVTTWSDSCPGDNNQLSLHEWANIATYFSQKVVIIYISLPWLMRWYPFHRFGEEVPSSIWGDADPAYWEEVTHLPCFPWRHGKLNPSLEIICRLFFPSFSLGSRGSNIPPWRQASLLTTMWITTTAPQFLADTLFSPTSGWLVGSEVWEPTWLQLLPGAWWSWSMTRASRLPTWVGSPLTGFSLVLNLRKTSWRDTRRLKLWWKTELDIPNDGAYSINFKVVQVFTQKLECNFIGVSSCNL